MRGGVANTNDVKRWVRTWIKWTVTFWFLLLVNVWQSDHHAGWTTDPVWIFLLISGGTVLFIGWVVLFVWWSEIL